MTGRHHDLHPLLGVWLVPSVLRVAVPSRCTHQSPAPGEHPCPAPLPVGVTCEQSDPDVRGAGDDPSEAAAQIAQADPTRAAADPASIR